MFTGLVESLGCVHRVSFGTAANRIQIESSDLAPKVQLGDSVAVNGVCLTVCQKEGSRLLFDVMPETVSKTNLSQLKSGSGVNLERALAMGDPVGGHLVTGHVDGIGTVVSRQVQGNATLFQIEASPGITDLLVPKGSVAVDGVSLTIVELKQCRFSVSLIPHTLKTTVLQYRQVGDQVNLETDMLGKYVFSYLRQVKEKSATPAAITADFLQQHGFL